MKNLNLIKRLWTDSHEKQKPQRLGRYAVMLLMLLTLSVGQMWAGAGFWGDDAVVLKYWLGGDDIEYKHKYSLSTTKDLGTVTSFYLKKWEFRTWKDGSGNICDYGRMYYRIYLTSASAPSYSYWSQDATSWSGNNQYHYDDCDNNILSGLGGGQYYFEYYFVAQGNTSSSSGCGTNITSNTYKIQFTIDPIVTFKANGGTGSDYTQTVTYNTSTALTANSFSKTGYDFAGWATSADGSVAYANQANITRTSNITLYAKWTAHNYTASNNIKHADGTTAGQYNVNYDATSISYTTTPSKTGYNIVGLYKQAAFTNKIVNNDRSLVASTSYTTSGSKWNQTSAPNLYVKWEAKTYNITLHDNNGGSNNGSATATYDGGLSSVSAPTKSGYHVVGYYKEAELTNLIADDEGNLEASTSYTDGSGNWTYDGTRTLYAKWESDATYYTLTYGAGSSPYNNGSVSAVNASTSAAVASGASLLSGTEVTFTATPTNSHYKLKGWYSDAACESAIAGAGTTNPYTRAINATQAVYAGFEIKTCAITLDRNGGSSGSTSVTATHGSTLPSFTAHGRTGYILNGYYTETSGGTKIINADGSLVASTSYANSSKQWNSDATSLTLHAQWTENKSTVTVNANQTSMGTLKFGSTGKSWGTTASVGVSTTQGITATANSGYMFDRWVLSGGAATSSSLTSATITLKGNGTGADGIAKAVFGKEYYYRGEKNDNGATLMTCDESGYYAYFSTSGTHKFKCAASTSTWDYNTYDNSYGNIILRDANDGYGNVYCPESGSHYIMIFYPNTAVNSENYPVIAAGTALFDPSKAILTLTSPSTSTTSLYCANNPMTIGVSATNLDGKTSLTYSYEYSEDKSSWSTITPTSSTSDGGTASCVWTTPNVPANKTYYVRAKLTYTYEAATVSVYSGASAAIKVTGTSVTTKTIKVKKPAEWDSFEGIHIWSSGDGDFNTSWPGFSIIVNHLGGSWYEFVIPSVCNNFVLNNGITEGSSNPDKYQTVDLTFSSSITDDNCYVLDNKTDASDGKYSPQKTYKYNLTHTDDCPETPTVSASAATNVTNVSATLNGRISDDGNDAITEYGFYWGTTSACANKQVKGTSFTPDNTYTHNLTGLTAGNTIYFKAFAKNGLGETVTTPATSFTVPYKVTITQPTGCSTITPGTGTQYVSVGDNIVATAATGYTFSSWSATNVTLGTPSTVTGVTTSAITAISADNGTIEPVYTANTYTVDFDVNGGTASTPDDKEVTFGSAYGTLPSGMTHTSKTFVGWYTDADDGEGDLITAETIVSTASDHTLYAHYENVYSVNVNFKSGTATIYPATSVTASPTLLAPTITAPEIFGYTFTGWTGSNATFGNASSATTTVNATAATTVTANYNVVPTVYFKNNLGWDSVFVTFDCGFNSSKENVPSNKGKPYYRMTQMGSTDVFYCVIPDSYKDSWTGKIAFDNTNYGKTGSTTHVGTWDAFFGGECIGRGDFDQKTTLYIPYSGETQSLNSTRYYPTGCWMKYNSTESGYQVNMNTWVNNEHDDTLCVKLTAANAGGYEFSAKLNLKHPNYTYGFKLYKIFESNETDLWYTNCPATISSATDDLPWHFWSGSSVTATSERCGLHTEALGDYTITVSFATGRPMVNVEYPASVGDWRLAYNDRVAWSGSTHDASWYIYSRVIKAKADAEDIVSFYVSKADGANAHVELQKCTAITVGGAETWTKQGSNLDISAITGTGIYNFKVTQNGSKVASATYLGGYEGNFYIRTDASDGGWNNYISSGKNLMTYSEYAEDNSGFTHYYMRYVTTGSNIKFCIANDYSECLTEYCVSDDFTNEYIEANGNVRFMWDHRTNAVSRAYISGSSVVSDRFLVLEGDEKLFNESGQALTTAGGGKVSGLNDNEMNFIDDQNWIYEATVKAQPKAKVKLTAKYNNQIQYFYGDEGDDAADSVLLLDGTGTDKYKMRIVYDFKTNRLLRAFIPDGEISAPMAINADMMIIREHQGDAQQVTFSGEGKLSAVKTVYGAMKFNKYTVNGKEKTGGHAGTGASRYERDLFYISFPFDVKLSDAFGFGTYGKHWIIEYYDGKGRAKNGFWADSEPNWKFVWPAQRSSFTMKAFEGYILALDLDEMTESSSVWNNNVEDVYIYFPSDGDVGGISATSRTVDIDQDGYQCTIGPRFAGGDDRRQKDSYWHCIGVPSFANYSSDLTPTSEDATTIDWRTGSLPYLYEWNSSNNTVSVTSSATFSFKATYSYLVQYSGDHIYWSSVNTPSSIVARERTAPKNAEFRIELQKAGEKADQTFVRLTQDENVTAGYDFNYDLSKEFNKNQANIYTMVTTLMDDGPSITEVAGNVQPMSEQTTVIPMGVKIAADGDYTFAIPDGTEGIGVTLIDNETGIRTSLSALDYTINLSAGTYENRFVLEISPIKQMPTGVEEVTGDGLQVTGVRKVMIDGILYIVKDGKVFDAHGNRVK